MAGVKGRSGRKPKLLKAFLEELLDEAWPRNKRLMVIKQLHELAMDGDVEAAKTLLAYAYGKPSQKHELSGAGGGPIELIELDARNILRAKLDNLALARTAQLPDSNAA